MENDSTVFVGVDVHKDSITAACVGSHPSEPPLASRRRFGERYELVLVTDCQIDKEQRRSD